MKKILPSIPFPEFPLRPHPNGQWCKSIWNPRSKRSELKYFGTWKDDPRGERALHEPNLGWLARRDAIKAGTDQLRHIQVADAGAFTVGDLMERFLQFNKRKVDAGDLSLRTLNDYLYEIPKFASFMRVSTPVEALRSEHFSAYMAHLVSNRKLGRYARRRVRVYVNVMLNYGVKNGWMVRPPTGSDWVAPATDRESMRVARMRAGIADNENRIFTGDEFDRVFNVATPAWRAMLLVAVNCGLGPADIGRLRWKHLSLETGRLDFPRGKTGVARVGYLWKRTRQALRKVRRLKRSLAAIARDGENALVFWSERGNPMYVETPQLALFQVDGREVKKLTHVRISGPIPCTFARLAKLAKLKGLSFYRLRHTTKTLGKAARDSEALDLIMGHANNSIGKLYDHTEIEFRRVKRVAIAIKHGLRGGSL